MTITIYADSNIFRYVSSGELEVVTVGGVRFAYSSVHFDEIIRTDNTDILKGIEALQAVPLVMNENGEYDINSIGVCLEYENPYRKYEKYIESYMPPSDVELYINELLIRLVGADNFEELKEIPKMIMDYADDAKIHFGEDQNLFYARAQAASNQLSELINGDFSTRRPLSTTRTEYGYPKGATSIHADDVDPINEIWGRLQAKMNGVTKEQFFGFEPVTGVEGEGGRIGSVSACHFILNMIGYHPDKGLPNRDKIRNIISDGQHLGYGSTCTCFLTSDFRLYKKARAIYKFRNFDAQAEHVEYKTNGMSITLFEPGSIRKVKLDRAHENDNDIKSVDKTQDESS